MSKHTPGPWQINDWTEVFDSEGNGIASVNTDSLASCFDNAKLISAAPEMAEALNYIVNRKPKEWDAGKAWDLALSALKKAGVL